VRVAEGQVRPLRADCARAISGFDQESEAMQAMLKMTKLDIAELERAAKPEKQFR
jgi:hypothetical protein